MTTRHVAVVMALCASTALAQPEPDTAEAHFKKGDTAYNLGRWDEAILHFTRAYEASPQPELLYNIAQAYRQAANCKQALHFYKRFRSLEEHRLSRRKRTEVDRFIQQLGECAAKAERTIATKPDTIDPPPPAPIAPPAPSGPAPEPAAQPAAVAQASTREPAPDVASELAEPSEAVASTPPAPRDVIAVRALAGIALLGADDLDIPVQPSFAVIGGHPIGMLELGAGISYTPLPYEAMSASRRGALVGVHAIVSGRKQLAPRLALRADVGIGAVALRGLSMGNPWTTNGYAGTFTLFNARIGIGADLAVTRTLSLTISPLSFAWSPGTDGLATDSIRQVDILIGIGGRR